MTCQTLKALNNISAKSNIASKKQESIYQYFPIRNINRETTKRNLDISLSTDISECTMPKITCTASKASSSSGTYQSSYSNRGRTTQQEQQKTSHFFNINRSEVITLSSNKTRLQLATDLKDVQEDRIETEILEPTERQIPVPKEVTYLPIIKCSATVRVPSVQIEAATMLSWSKNHRSSAPQNAIQSTDDSLPLCNDGLNLKTEIEFDNG